MLQASSDSEASPLTLVNIPLDLQIIICTLLHPSDILALRVTCRTLQLPTRQRAVWVAALHRVCLDNSLFLPSFPILDMSWVELEHAAMGPRRWIELCTSFEKQHPHDPVAKLRPKTTRIIQSPPEAGDYLEIFIVPGGRYVVTWSYHGIFVWDLGYTSSADCKLIGSGGPEGIFCSCMIQATPDGTGLIILASHQFLKRSSVYEIYPQSETPQLACIAHIDSDRSLPTKPWACLLPDRVLWYRPYGGGVIFRIWDYRMNYSTSFSGDVDFDNLDHNFKVIATTKAIFLLCMNEILIWAIPPLSPLSPDLFNNNPTHIPILFRLVYPDCIVRSISHGFAASQTMSHWYFGSSQPLYFDILCQNSKLHRFEIIVKPNIFDTTLNLINTEIIPHDFDNVIFQSYRICEDTLVSCWDSHEPGRYGVYTGLTSSRSTTVISHGCPAAKTLLSVTPSMKLSGYSLFLCPASGRYVHLDKDICRIVVVDLF